MWRLKWEHKCLLFFSWKRKWENTDKDLPENESEQNLEKVAKQSKAMAWIYKKHILWCEMSVRLKERVKEEVKWRREKTEEERTGVFLASPLCNLNDDADTGDKATLVNINNQSHSHDIDIFRPFFSIWFSLALQLVLSDVWMGQDFIYFVFLRCI